jgi:hypothetical protein
LPKYFYYLQKKFAGDLITKAKFGTVDPVKNIFFLILSPAAVASFNLDKTLQNM